MKTKKILAVFLITMTLFSVLAVSALSLSWDGSSAGGSTNAVNGSNKGYVIRSTNDDACVVGYRFSVVNNSGDMKVNKVIDVFRNTTNGSNAYSTSAKFSTKYNKKQLIANMNARLETINNTTNCYKESSMGFVTALPNPSGVKTWQAYETNINKVLSKIGVGSVSNMYYGDKVIIEPLFDVCLAGEYQALTVTEIAYCGRSVLGGSSTGGTSNGTSSTWGFIANYTNRIWPNKLFTPDGQGLWTAASTIGSSSKASFNTLLNYGYGAGIAYSETQNLSYTIKFNGNGATSGSTASMSMSYGTAKNLTANGFKKTGNVFTGWNTKADGSGTKYTDKQSVKNLTTTNGATVNLYAQWKAYVLTICYDCYGSSPTFTESKGFSFGNYNRILTTGSSRKTIAGTDNVYYNAYNYNNEIGGYGLHDFSTFGLTAPTGYKFKCWDHAGKSFDETTTTYRPTDFTSDIVNGDTYVWMTAKFSPIEYSVKFNGNGATSGSMSNQSFTYDTSKALTANAFKREFTVTYNYNYSGKANTTAKASATFNGWAKTSSGSVTYTNKQTVKNLSSVDGDVVNIYAKWTDASVTLPTPTRTGSSFSGWYTASSGGTKIGSGGASYKPTGNITVYAHWSASSYTVTYNANGGSGAPSAQTKTHGVDLTLSSAKPTRTGYIFKNWNTNSGGSGTTYASGGKYTANASVTLYAQWTPHTYTVTYKPNGGSGEPAAQTKTYGVDLTLSSTKPTRTGYDFKNWNTASNGSGTTYASGAKYTQNYSLTLYAQWTPHTYTVTYKANGGSGEPAAQTKTYGVDLTLSSAKPTRTGYTFKNWNTNSGGSGTTYASGGKYTANASVTLYAQWTPITYTIIFNGNGYTSGSTASMTMTYDTAKNLTANGFVKTSYVFTGWNTKSNGSGISYANKQSVKNLTTVNGATITLYAQWTPITYTIVFNGNGSTSGSTASMIVKYDEEKNLNENRFVRTGYEFVQWNLKADGTDRNFADKQAIKNLTTENNAVITMYAQWKKIHRLSLEPITPNAAYREGTDVITSYTLINESLTPCVPDDNVSVVFKVYANNVLIATETASKVVVPGSDTNLLYFKWAVPDDHGTGGVTITAEIVEQDDSYGLVSKTYQTCKYVIASTPDTQYEASAPDGFVRPDVPSESSDTASWSVWVYDNGAFRKVNYAVAISDDKAAVTPDISANAAFSNGLWTMKSGYGFGIEVNNAVKAVSGYTMPETDAYTLPQYSVAKFPEFSFTTEPNKYRTLEIVSGKWAFRENEEYGRIHFTPLWYPDGEYTVTVLQQDCWTPAGMISRQVNSDEITISGSAYDDWYLS